MVLETLMNQLAETTRTCRQASVDYDHRAQDYEKYNWCVVPDSGSDAVLFISTALLASCICSGQLSALYILLLGEAALVMRHAPMVQVLSLPLWLLASYKELCRRTQQQ